MELFPIAGYQVFEQPNNACAKFEFRPDAEGRLVDVMVEGKGERTVFLMGLPAATAASLIHVLDLQEIPPSIEDLI